MSMISACILCQWKRPRLVNGVSNSSGNGSGNGMMSSR